MRKRERENPCGVCGHYHKYEEGEVCGVCGHRAPALGELAPVQQSSAFPSEILKDFLYLGSYDNASRSELLKTQGISRILNTVPACQPLYKNSFTYYNLQEGNTLQFDDAIRFLEQCYIDKARVLVHCMSGKNRSPAIVIAYLMKCNRWRLSQSLQWVKDRRPVVSLSAATYQQLVDYEKRLFESNPSLLPSDTSPPFGFGFPRPPGGSSPVFNQPSSTSIFGRTHPNISPNEFVFSARRNEQPAIVDNGNLLMQSARTESPMDSF